MRIKINSDGFLLIERAGMFKTQDCPYCPTVASCGDWCPMFGDPEKEDSDSRLFYSIEPHDNVYILEVMSVDRSKVIARSQHQSIIEAEKEFDRIAKESTAEHKAIGICICGRYLDGDVMDERGVDNDKR